jgi:NDP-sugar pyrophosphorylase family protein
MKAVILAGGLGTRLSEETATRPKPMVEIGGYPILWHILKMYSHHGINDFVICCGYKGYLIKEYFATSIEPESNRLLSEDYHFCKIAREAGFKVYAAPWAQFGHTGTYTFSGQLPRSA